MSDIKNKLKCENCHTISNLGRLNHGDFICDSCLDDSDRDIDNDLKESWDNYHKYNDKIPNKIKEIYKRKFAHFTDLSFIDDILKGCLDFSETELKQLIQYILLENMSFDD